MSIRDIIKAAPYYTDLDPTKNRMMVLFRPGPAVQTRELNEIQAIFHSQVSSFANHIFANGSKVLGGEITRKSVRYYKLENTYNAIPVDLSDWLGKTVYAVDSLGNDLGLKATVIAYANATDTDSPTLYVEYDSEAAIAVFPTSTVLRVVDSGLSAKTIADTTTYTGFTLYVGVSAGIYYIDECFVSIDAQSILAAKYKSAPTGLVGFVYDTQVVTADTDPDLRDPATGRNRSAVGADRIVMTAGLAFYEDAQDKPDNFVPVIEIQNGVVNVQKDNTTYSQIADEFARRTFDESGNYTVRPFRLTTRQHVGTKIVSITASGSAVAHVATAKCAAPHALVVGAPIQIDGVTGPDGTIYNGQFVVQSLPDTYTFTYSMTAAPGAAAVGDSMVVTRPDYFTAELSAGKGYVRGYEIETIAPTYVDVPKARISGVMQNYSSAVSYGNYVTGTLSGLIDDTIGQTVTLKNASATAIGTARVRYVTWFSGTPGSGSAKYAVYLYNIVLTSGKFGDVRTVVAGGGTLTVDLTNGNAVLQGGNQYGGLFKAPEVAVKTLMPGGVADLSYLTQFRGSLAVAGASNTVAFNVTGSRYFIGTVGAELSGTSTANSHYIFTRSDTGAPIAPTSLQLSAGGQTVTANFAVSGITINMQATIQVSQSTPKTKASTQETISVPFSSNNSAWMSLNVADVYQIVSIKKQGGTGIELLNTFYFDNGQRDDMYDHASIKGPTSNPDNLVAGTDTLLVTVKRFTHSGTGYFSVDSYSGFKRSEIPTYVSPITGARVPLSDALDFRPVRQQGSTSVGGFQVPRPDSLITSDYEFYLPRRDRLVLDKNGLFKTVMGTPALAPYLPAEPDDAMTLYELYIHPYTDDPSADVDCKFIENKRYTMRDIGLIDKRVGRLEYYTELSLLEMAVKSSDVVDTNGNDRFKNGFLVDNFTGHGVGDVYNGNYRCAIDPVARELRAPFLSARLELSYSADSTSVRQVGNSDTGSFLTLPYTETVLSANLNATKAESVNPYLVIDFKGSMNCYPPSDDWMDTQYKPAVNVNLTGDSDAWNFMAGAINTGMAPGYGTQWNDWQTTWSGVTDVNTTQAVSGWTAINVINNGQVGSSFTGTTTTTTAVTTRTDQTRTGSQTTVGFGVESASIGAKVVDVNLVYWMRSVSIAFSAAGLRPNTNLHVFIDDTKVNSYVTPTAGYAPTTEGCVRTDANGIAKGVIAVPAGKFRTGERVIKLIDEPNDVEDNASTWASYVFVASGLVETKQDSIVSTRVPVLSTTAISQSQSFSTVDVTTQQSADVIFTPYPAPPPAPVQDVPQRDPNDFRGAEGAPDPLAQTFFVNDKINPYGVFITSVTVFFKNKPASGGNPVWMEIRPVVNGYPHSSKAVPLTRMYKTPDEVNLPTATDDIASIRAAGTTFVFPVPIYLEPGENAFIFGSNSAEYELYVAEMGQQIYGTNQIVAGQVSLGSLFKSQNASTWTASQFEDLMMQINRASFDVNATGVAVSKNVSDGTSHHANTLMHTAGILTFDPATTLKQEFKILDTGTTTMPADWTLLQRDINIDLPFDKTANATGDLLVQTTMQTSREDVAPLFDLSNNSMTLVANQINNDSTGENNASGGNALARYITRQVTLADNMDTDFLKVTIDMYRPVGTDVQVYVKAISADDPTPFLQRNWVQMVIDTSKPVYSQAAGQFIETNFVPASGSLQYTSGGITYTRAKTYAVKIVMLSTNTSVVPKVRDLRVISTMSL